MARVFISYRRSDSRWAAGRLYDRVAEVLGRDNVFFDIDNIEPGEDFIKRINDTVGTCDLVIVVIGLNWLDARNRAGTRRLDSTADLIRNEIGTALRREIRVIPVLIDGAEMPEEHQLPEELATLARRNAHDISFAHFHNDVDSFVRVLQRILAGPAAAPRTVSEARAEQTNSGQPPIVVREMPHTLSIETLGGMASALIAKGTKLPADFEETFSTAADDQSSIEVQLFLGERARTQNNVSVGKFQLNGLSPQPRGVAQVKLKAVVDPSLVLTVTAEDQGTGRKEVLDAVDLTRFEVSPSAQEPDPVPADPPPSEPVAQEKPSAGPSFRDLFSDLFSSKQTPAAKDTPGSNDRLYDLTLSLEDAVFGTTCELDVQNRKLKVNIPPGVNSGTRLRLQGEGAKSASSGKAGDLYVAVTVADHPVYKRTEQDLYCTVRIPAADATAGTIVELPALGKHALGKFRVPPNSSTGTRFRLPGLGIPSLSKPVSKGHIFVTIVTDS